MDSKINSLAQLAYEYSAIKGKYERLARDYINQADPLEEDEFWLLMNGLASSLVEAKGQKKVAADMPNSKPVIDEFVRSHLFAARCRAAAFGSEKSYAAGMMQTWQKLASFVKSYSQTKAVIYSLCGEFTDLDMGDDGFGDFCDSFVIAGPDMIKRIKDGDIATMHQISKATIDHPLQRFMLRGENYMEMHLGEALVQKLPSVARSLFSKDD